MRSDLIWRGLNRVGNDYIRFFLLAAVAVPAAVLLGLLLAAGIYAITSWPWTTPLVVGGWIALAFGIRQVSRRLRPTPSEAERKANRELSSATLIVYFSLVLGGVIVSSFGKQPPLIVLGLVIACIVAARIHYGRANERRQQVRERARASAEEPEWAHKISVDVGKNGSESYWCEGCNFQTRRRTTAAKHADFAGQEEPVGGHPTY
jgi:hypothetical protein